MTKVFIVPDVYGMDTELYQHESKRSIDCDGCDNKIKKGDYYTEADVGEKYCEDCFTSP